LKVAKPFEISKKLVWQAYLEVKSNGGAAGVDKESIEAFEQNLKNNLYQLWNRFWSQCSMRILMVTARAAQRLMRLL
jgi:RNA-directed DNA polymerase